MRNEPVAHDGTLAGLLAARVAHAPERAFLLFEPRRWSWAAFADEVARTAGLLAGGGVGRGDRVAALSANSDALVTLLFAAARVGAIFVPLDPALPPAELRARVAHAEPRALAASEPCLAAAREAGAPWLFQLGDSGAPAPPGGGPDDACVMVYTSGTTAHPKGVLHTQRSVVLAGEAFVERMRLSPDDRLLCILPLFHINALLYSLMGAVAAGASLVLAPRFSASQFWRLVAASGATEVNLLAALGSMLARRPRSEFVAGHRLCKIYGAAIPPEVADVFQRELGVPTIIEGYGMTEVPGVTSQPFAGPHKRGSMGPASRHPDPARQLAELRVVDDSGRDLPDGETGELWVRTPLVMQGYFRDPEATAAAFRDGWFVTGDLVRRDADGHVSFVARKKDIIRRRGENISGAELDRVLGLHPAVAEAAAIAVPSQLGEDDILAVVVTRPGAQLSAAELAAHCAQQLAAHKVPRYVAFVAELPHTPSHRVAKFQLREDPTLLARAVDLQRYHGGA